MFVVLATSLLKIECMVVSLNLSDYLVGVGGPRPDLIPLSAIYVSSYGSIGAFCLLTRKRTIRQVRRMSITAPTTPPTIAASGMFDVPESAESSFTFKF